MKWLGEKKRQGFTTSEMTDFLSWFAVFQNHQRAPMQIFPEVMLPRGLELYISQAHLGVQTKKGQLLKIFCGKNRYQVLGKCSILSTVQIFSRTYAISALGVFDLKLS